MKPDPETGVLAPFDFSTIYDEFPYLGKLDVELEVINLTPIDSSNVTPELWCELARLIRDNYDAYDGFVVLHGTDTMSYSASALSFMLVNLAKPVIFTGSQIPIGVLRTDGRENLITAVEIAAAREGGRAVVPEVCICFQNKLFRANRTTKHSAEQLNAFRSDNYPILAEVGVSIHYNRPFIRRPAPDPGPLRIVTRLDTRIAVVHERRDVHGDARHSGAARGSTRNVRCGQRPHGRLVHRCGVRSRRTRRRGAERHAMFGRQRFDGDVRNGQTARADRRDQRA